MEQATEQVQRQALKDMVTEFLVKQGQVPQDVAAKGDARIEDLGIDSLSMVEMVYEVEEKYGIQVEDMNQLKGMTIDELVDFMQVLVGKKAAQGGSAAVENA